MAPRATPAPRLSVVVPAYNAGRIVRGCVDALLAQSLGRDDYEVIVVDNNSSDDTWEVLGAYGEKIVRRRELRRGPAWARNAGIAVARGEVIAFTDADCVPQPRWLERITAPVVGGSAEVCGGWVVPVNTDSEIERFGAAWFWPIDKFVTGEFFYMPFAITANAAYSTALLRGIGGFDPTFPVAGYEDTDLGWRAFQAGARFVFAPDAIVKHHHRTTLRGLLHMGYKGRFGRELLVHKFAPIGVQRPTLTYEALLLGWSFLRDAALGNARYGRRSWILFDYAFRAGTVGGMLAGRRHLSRHAPSQVEPRDAARPLVSNPYPGGRPTAPRALHKAVARTIWTGLYAVNRASRAVLREHQHQRLLETYRERVRLPAVQLRRAVWRTTNRVQRVALDLDFYHWVEADIAGALRRHFSVDIIPSAPHESLFEHGEGDAGELTLDNYRRPTWKGLSLWELCKVSLCKHVGRLPAAAWEAADLPVVANYYHWARRCLAAIDDLLERHRPDAVWVCQGGVYDSRCVVELARRRGIRCVALENTFARSHFFADAASGIIVNRQGLGLVGGFVHEAEMLSEQELERARSFFRAQLRCKDVQHRTGGLDAPAAIAEALRLPRDKRLILLLGQVRFDASIVLDSTAWQDPADLAAAVVRYVESHDDNHLVIRLHPREQRDIAYSHGDRHREVFAQSSYAALQARGLDQHSKVTIVTGTHVNTHALMELCDAGITINSQAGLEMALLGKSVVTSGRCFYSGAGFTWDIGAPDLLPAALDAALASRPTEAQTLAKWRFAHYLFFRYMLPKTLDDNLERLRAVFALPPM